MDKRGTARSHRLQLAAISVGPDLFGEGCFCSFTLFLLNEEYSMASNTGNEKYDFFFKVVLVGGKIESRKLCG
jgi:hypothetical protein